MFKELLLVSILCKMVGSALGKAPTNSSLRMGFQPPHYKDEFYQKWAPLWLKLLNRRLSCEKHRADVRLPGISGDRMVSEQFDRFA